MVAEQNKIKQLIEQHNICFVCSYCCYRIYTKILKLIICPFAFDLIDHIATDRQTGGRTDGRAVDRSDSDSPSITFIYMRSHTHTHREISTQAYVHINIDEYEFVNKNIKNSPKANRNWIFQ